MGAPLPRYIQRRLGAENRHRGDFATLSYQHWGWGGDLWWMLSHLGPSGLLRDSGGAEVMKVSPAAGKPAEASMLVTYPDSSRPTYTEAPDPLVSAPAGCLRDVGHRGSAFEKAFNERTHPCHQSGHLPVPCPEEHRTVRCFLGMDTHALSLPALASALEVLAANGVEVMLSQGMNTPDACRLHAILTYNRRRKTGLADGIVVHASTQPAT